jgi:hypothetical protein
MWITLVGGMDRLRRQYEQTAEGCGVSLKVFTGKESCLADKMGTPDMTILFTGMVSHQAKAAIMNSSRSRGIPVHFLHTNGISGLRECLRKLACTEAAVRAGP